MSERSERDRTIMRLRKAAVVRTAAETEFRTLMKRASALGVPNTKIAEICGQTEGAVRMWLARNKEG